MATISDDTALIVRGVLRLSRRLRSERPVSTVSLSALSLLSSHNKGLTCLLCAQCVSSCPEHIGISDIFRYERYARDYHDLDRARSEYAALTRNGTSCVGCGDCLPTCSQEIDIAAKLKDVHRLLG